MRSNTEVTSALYTPAPRHKNNMYILDACMADTKKGHFLRPQSKVTGLHTGPSASMPDACTLTSHRDVGEGWGFRQQGIYHKWEPGRLAQQKLRQASGPRASAAASLPTDGFQQWNFNLTSIP